MTNSDDRAYYAGRILEEMERGDRAADPAVAAVHYELAHRYSLLAGRTDAETPKLKLVHGGKGQLAA